jgi:hypothetical protein
MICGIAISLKPEDNEVRPVLGIRWNMEKSGYYHDKERDCYVLVAEYCDRENYATAVTVWLDKRHKEQMKDPSEAADSLREKAKRRLLHRLANLRYRYSHEELSSPLFFIWEAE